MARVGASELDVFPLCLGANTFGWTADAAASHAVLDAYREGGGNFLDTADSYSFWAPGNEGGESEALIGEWLAARPGARERIVLATKVFQSPARPGLAAANVAAAIEDSLRRLRSDHVDLYYAHYDDPEVPLEETIGAFEELVRVGKVRYVGLSNYEAPRIAEWIELAAGGPAAPVALQPHYNLVEREPFESETRPLAEEHGLGVMPYYGLAAGFLTGKYRSAADATGVDRAEMVGGYLTAAGFAVVEELEAIATELGSEPGTVALAWLRSRPTVAAPIASARTAAQVAGLLEAAELELGAEALARLDRAADQFAAAA